MGMTLLDSWAQFWDPSSEHFFYYNGSTGLTTWEPPYPLQEDNNRPPSRDHALAHETATPRAGIHLSETWNSPSRENEDTTLRRANRASHGRSTDPYSSNRGWDRKPEAMKIHDEEPKKDYLHFATEYSAMAPYRDTKGKQACVICQRRRASGVFFPCEHKCVCTRCIASEGFGKAGIDAASVCPVCCQQVVFVVPYKDGHEADKYWHWVQEVTPPLPRGFQEKFHMAAILLKIKSEPDSHKTWDRPGGCCVLS